MQREQGEAGLYSTWQADAKRLYRALQRQCQEGTTDAYVFRTLSEVRQKTEERMEDYNHHRPHQVLNFKLIKEIVTLKPTLQWPKIRGSLHSPSVDFRTRLLPN
ncbi:integrase core domain-containing protein [Pontibacter silvestris]|uniref:integrase core domain-containing protein n=1 Tax=Pontibacter silvestris TaxID=2305183 RepID=UPI001E4D219E|nr:integrase core domain-containing protein [Pontibacter silvestris]MCC9138920.1 integrase core domain-containing protein [Pontibacter silvestris]